MHQPVMLDEVISSLELEPGDTVLDATIGGGGHAAEILKRIMPGGLLIGLDADPSAVDIARKRLEKFGASVRIKYSNFRNLDSALSEEGVRALDAALFDVGVSSYQLDDPARGFGLKVDGRLDMRMDPLLKLSAYDIVNRADEKYLCDIVKNFGEERYYRRIVHRIIEHRRKRPIETTLELKTVICGAIGSTGRYSKIDPATRTFQAIRIAVNDELGSLEDGIKKAMALLEIGARIAVISFHSLEDRIVKRIFKGYASLGIVKIITKKPVNPSEREVALNVRARSGRLRVAERS